MAADVRDGPAPRLADGLRFLGEFQASGHAHPPMLIQRGDGQVLQLSPLLYTLASCVDGQAGVGALAERVSAKAPRRLTTEGVEYLLEQKLRPLGLLTSDNGSPQVVPRASPLLALAARRNLLAERTVNRVSAKLEPLFRPVAIAVVLVCLALVDYAILIDEGLGRSVHALAVTPAYLLAVLALVVASTCFHELGHAAGCRYGGGRPSGIGVGIYLVWPAFYTNVNDAYRLSRAGRLRTDLGGGYFSLISVVALGAAYVLSGWPPLALAVFLIQLQMIQQLLPIVRFDGYYVLSDLVGVPDLFSRVAPILRNLFRRQPPDPRVRDLRPRVRAVVTLWVLAVVPLLVAGFALVLIELPGYLRTSWSALRVQVAASERAVGTADVLTVAGGVVHVVALVLPVAGITLVVSRLGRRVAYSVRAGQRRRRDPGRRPQQRHGAPVLEAEVRADRDRRPARNRAGGRLRRKLQRVVVTSAAREEAAVEQRIRRVPGVTGPNVIALISPEGGVGKTTSTFLVGNLLATHLKLRAVAVDANPDLGTRGLLSPDERRFERSLEDLPQDADRLRTAAQLDPYISRQRTGLHLLAAPRDAELTATLGPDRYRELVALLSGFYEVVLLDLGAGVAGPVARFAIERADQVVLVATPEWVTAPAGLDALAHLQHDHTTVVLNKSVLKASDVRVVAQRFRAKHLHRTVAIPYDEQLATMLDSGTYTLDALGRRTRIAIKQLGLSVAQRLM